MLYNYAALAVFTILALLVPSVMILASKLIGRRKWGNPVKNAPWESGEVSVGRSRDIENEYLPFFSLFLPFEIIVGMLLSWSMVAYNLSFSVDVAMISLALAGSAAVAYGYKVIVG